MTTRRLAAFALVPSLVLVHAAWAQTVGSSVLSSGGGDQAGATNRIRGTVGQPIVGVTTGPAPITNIVCHGFWCVEHRVAVAVEDNVGDRPLSFALPGPNPAHGTIALGFHLPKPATIEMAIFDVRGAHIATLANGPSAPGSYTVRWYGMDAGGRRCASGVYFASLRVDGRSLGTRRFVLLR